MSWHCAFCGSSDNDKTWVYLNIAFVDGGIPINVVAHAECLQKQLFSEADNIIEVIDDRLFDIKERNNLLDKADEED